MQSLISCESEGYIVVKLNGEQKEDILSDIANELFREGYVKNTYSKAILAREEKFPTGLPTPGIGIAIPHTDSEHVLKEGIALGILDNPVKFNLMGGCEKDTVDVEIVFMLAIKEKEAQLEMLQKLVTTFQDENKLKILKNTDKLENIEMIMKELKK